MSFDDELNNFGGEDSSSDISEPTIPSEPPIPQEPQVPENLSDPFSAPPISQPTPQPMPQPPVQPPITNAVPPQSGSYYSPRSGYPSPAENHYNNQRGIPNNGGGGNYPPDGGSFYNSPESPNPPKKSHKGLKALAIFACVALLCYTSIQCYQFASENESFRKFFGHDNKVTESEKTGEETPSLDDDEKDSKKEEKPKTEPTGVAQDWIQLAAREGAMSIPDIVDKVMPSSVGVSSTFVGQGQSFSMWGFGMTEPYEKEMTGTGTGIIMNEDGYIVTNAHVIYDNESQYKCGLAKKVQVVLNDQCYEGETQFEAEVIGYDVEEDLAVLKIDTDQKLVTAEFGSSDELRVGELVVAIGNPLGFDLFGSVSTGIVSALDREMTINESTMRLIQTDTAINAGNSGGPLINSFGQVVGINSAKLSSSYYGEASVEGLCFAIPMSHAKQIVDDLISFGFVRGKPLLGISGYDVTETASQQYGLPIGVSVVEVVPGGAADLAGIQVNDIIIAINGETITTYEELNSIKNTFKAGDTITVTVARYNQDIDFSVTLQEKQPTENAASN